LLIVCGNISREREVTTGPVAVGIADRLFTAAFPPTVPPPLLPHPFKRTPAKLKEAREKSDFDFMDSPP
jgi:hypothetical protein